MYIYKYMYVYVLLHVHVHNSVCKEIIDNAKDVECKMWNSFEEGNFCLTTTTNILTKQVYSY